MVLEVTSFSVRPGQEVAFEQAFRQAREIIAESPGCCCSRTSASHRHSSNFSPVSSSNAQALVARSARRTS